MKLKIVLTLASLLCFNIAHAIPYKVEMDNVDSSLSNWSFITDDIGDLYDLSGVKQVDVSYAVKANFGNTVDLGNEPQYWLSKEYGNNHSAIFAPQGGSDVLEVEIKGLNGNLINLSQVTVGRWYPDGLNTNATDWKVYDGAWNLLADGSTVMTDFVDYFLNFNFQATDTIRFQFGDDNWDNGIIDFTFESSVAGFLDLDIDGQENPTPNLPGAGATNVSEPSTIAMFGALLIGLGFYRRRKHCD